MRECDAELPGPSRSIADGLGPDPGLQNSRHGRRGAFHVARIQSCGAHAAGPDEVDGKLLLEPTRKQSIAFPRQIAMFLLRTELALPLNQIGDLFGGRDHTTVLHSVEKIESGKEGDKNTKTALHTIHERLQAFRSE